jgi:thiamine biosynthesis lipoprotein
MRLDLGGVAKGWAATRAARALSALGPALVDAGGDVAVSAPRAGGQGWPVGVAAPYSAAGEMLVVLNVTGGGVATSGRDYRRWQQGGVSQHHLIDASTGRPAQTDVLSATVLAPELWQAEMAAKVVVVSGAEAGLAWLEARPQLAGLICVEPGPPSVITSRRLGDYLWN